MRRAVRALPCIPLRAAVAVLLVGLVLVGGCSSDDESVETVELGPAESRCIDHDIRGVDPGELCFTRTDDRVAIAARGLADGSELTVRGGDGGTITFAADADGHIDAELGPPVAEGSFDVRATWADGESVALTVDYVP